MRNGGKVGWMRLTVGVWSDIVAEVREDSSEDVRGEGEQGGRACSGSRVHMGLVEIGERGACRQGTDEKIT